MRYDLIVLGGGSAGLVAAKFAKGLGKSVAIVEKHKLGGDCTHFGCVPSKALLKSAHVAKDIKNLNEYGLSMDTSTLDASKVLLRVKQIVDGVYDGETPDVFRAEGIDIIEGFASFLDKKTIEVKGRAYRAEKFIIATGSSPFIPPVTGLSETNFLTNETVFKMTEMPDSIAVLGGGPIGVELASAFNSLGVDTALIELADNILPREDPELTRMLRRQLEDEGMNILTGTKVLETIQEDGFVRIKTEGKVEEVLAKELLVAVGRKPNLDGLGLDKAGVAYDRKGLKVDKYLKTTADNIYACGDVVPPYQFTHVADYEAVIAVGNALLPFRKKRKYDLIPWCIYTSPELARCGLTEEEAISQYGKEGVSVYKFEYNHIDRAITDSNTTGISKYITNKKGKLLGIHILGERAGEVIHEPMLAMKHGIPFQKIKDMIHIYPTYSYVVRQPSKYAAIEMLLNMPIVKFLRGLKD
jgi:dihydrolipoamide dehydrogenase